VKTLCTLLIVLSALAVSPGAAAQKQSIDTVATFTVNVTAEAPAASSKRVAAGEPKMERVNGSLFMTLEKQYSGRAFEVAKGNYIALRFPPSTGAIGFEVSPPGIFKFHEGIVHLPLNTLGFLQAENPGTATITVKGFAPPAAPVQFISSNNSWSGYVVPGGPFASVVGSWTVPVVYSDAGQYSATWVGIDGTSSTPLIQTGIEQTYSSGFLGLFGGGPSYFAWYQVVPADAVTIPKPVSPGDKITAFVMFGGQGLPIPGVSADWYIYMNNETQNWFYTAKVSYAGPVNSAEWIEEAPTYCGWFSGCSVQQLADYGTVTFDSEDFLNSGSPDLKTSEETEISQSSHVVSIPSDPDADLDGFTLFYGSLKPAPPGPFISTTSLPEAYVNLAYHQPLIAAGGTDFQWSGSGLPAWLTLNPSTGVLSGTPPSPGVFPFSVVALQQNEINVRTQLQPLTLTVGATPPPPDFALSVSPFNSYLVSGACTASVTVTVTPLYGFSGQVSLSIADAPGSSFDPAATFTTSHLALHSSPCAPGGTTRIYTITGTSGALVHTAAVAATPPIKQTCPDLPGPKPLPYCP
jgi:Peptidase A4 family/Putative Ig domain